MVLPVVQLMVQAQLLCLIVLAYLLTEIDEFAKMNFVIATIARS